MDGLQLSTLRWPAGKTRRTDLSCALDEVSLWRDGKDHTDVRTVVEHDNVDTGLRHPLVIQVPLDRASEVGSGLMKQLRNPVMVEASDKGRLLLGSGIRLGNERIDDKSVRHLASRLAGRPGGQPDRRRGYLMISRLDYQMVALIDDRKELTIGADGGLGFIQHVKAWIGDESGGMDKLAHNIDVPHTNGANVVLDHITAYSHADSGHVFEDNDTGGAVGQTGQRLARIRVRGGNIDALTLSGNLGPELDKAAFGVRSRNRHGGNSNRF